MNMNTFGFVLLAGATAMSLCLGSCVGGTADDKQQKDSTSVEDTTTTAGQDKGKDSASAGKEVKGRAGDGTSMHSLELLTDAGDTLYFFYENNAIGGITCGDQLDVVYKTDCNNELAAQTIVNLTSLAHVWSVTGTDGQKRHIELDRRGTVTVYGVGSGYERWSMDGGRLVLSNKAEADTFNITLLTDDSLILADVHKENVMRMRRKN